MLAAICCLKAWRYFLEKTKKSFKILTDHKSQVLHKKLEAKLETSKIGIISIKVQSCFEAHFG